MALPEEPLAERTPGGMEKAALNPISQIISSLVSLYYVQVYISNPDQLREMDEMFIHWDVAPLFESEIPDEEIVMPFEGDPKDGGMFVYAFMPAITYNLIRTAALLGEETYKAMPMRTVPLVARAWDGSVKWEYIAGSLLEYAPAHTVITDAGETALPSILEEGVNADGSVNKRWGRRLRQFARKTRDAVRTTVDAVRTGVGKLAKAVRPETKLTLDLKVPNRAPGFGKPQRAWDQYGALVPTYSRDLRLTNTRVNVSQLGGISLFKTRTNDDGFAKVSVPRDRKTQVCVEAESGAARMESGLLWPVRHCFKRFESKGSSQAKDWTVNDSEFFALAQIIDARDFATRALGHTPDKATIQTGKFADLLAVESTDGKQRAFVPCLEAPNAPVSLVDGYATALNLLSGAGDWVEFALTTDIVLPKDAQESRLIPVHEYGHFFLCDLLNHENGRTYNYVWSQVIKTTVPPFNDETSEVAYINEGFADWFASQVAGGVRYFELDGRGGTSAGTESNGDATFFFNPGAPAVGLALEENVGMLPCSDKAAVAFPNCQHTIFDDKEGRGVATWTTLFHDIIDREKPNQPNGAGNYAELTSDAAMWVATTTIDPVTKKSSTSFSLKKASPWGTKRDEEVELPAEAMIDGIRDFANSNGAVGTRLTGPKLFTSLSLKMSSPWGYSAAQICALLKLHRDDGKCPDSWVPQDTVLPPI